MHSHRFAPEKAAMIDPRSWLFVPADSEKKIAKALDSEADAIIFDLEDSVAPALKQVARDVLKGLPKRDGGALWWVRVNPLGSEHHKDDLELIGLADVHGIVLPKTESGADVIERAHRTGTIPIHAIVTETAASLFNLLTYRDPASPLAAMSWGAEDLSAALGASSKYDESGDLSFTYKLARSLCLAGAVAAGVQPVDGVFADFKNEKGLRAEAEAARREGFTGKLAIHPAQVPIINAAFSPSDADVGHAEAIVAAFEAHPGAGVLSVDGKMVDRPHLAQAQRILERSTGGQHGHDRRTAFDNDA
jgi:citrate lyase subunit beta/citryl-CoA lyase